MICTAELLFHVRCDACVPAADPVACAVFLSSSHMDSLREWLEMPGPTCSNLIKVVLRSTVSGQIRLSIDPKILSAMLLVEGRVKPRYIGVRKYVFIAVRAHHRPFRTGYNKIST